MFAGKRIACAVGMLEREFDHVADDQFETCHGAADAGLRQVEQLHGGGGGGNADESGFDRAGAREQLDHGGSDDAERAFGANENMAQVVAGIVLFELRQQVDDPAIG